HQVRFPMTGLSSLVDVCRPPIDRYSVLDMIHWATAFVSTPAPLALAPGKVMAPAVVLGAADLRVDKPIDRLMSTNYPEVASSRIFVGIRTPSIANRYPWFFGFKENVYKTVSRQ